MKMPMYGWMMGCIACMACSSTVGTWAQTMLDVEVLAEDLTVPWDLVWGPDNHVWCMEKTGRITRTNPDTKVVEDKDQ